MWLPQFFLSGGKTEGGYVYRFSLVFYLGEDDVEGARTKTVLFFGGMTARVLSGAYLILKGIQTTVQSN